MGLDINMFREEKGYFWSYSGGNPNLIRDSLKRRYQKTEIVDEIIEMDHQWRKCILALK